MVTRCICCDIAFDELLPLARTHSTQTVPDLQQVACVGTGCGLCLPYVTLMLRTGRVAFDPAEGFDPAESFEPSEDVETVAELPSEGLTSVLPVSSGATASALLATPKDGG